MAGHGELAQRLLDAGASLTGQLCGTEGGSALALALFYGKGDIATFMLIRVQFNGLKQDYDAAAITRRTIGSKNSSGLVG
jgi:hypothetical protein